MSNSDDRKDDFNRRKRGERLSFFPPMTNSAKEEYERRASQILQLTAPSRADSTTCAATGFLGCDNSTIATAEEGIPRSIDVPNMPLSPSRLSRGIDYSDSSPLIPQAQAELLSSHGRTNHRLDAAEAMMERLEHVAGTLLYLQQQQYEETSKHPNLNNSERTDTTSSLTRVSSHRSDPPPAFHASFATHSSVDPPATGTAVVPTEVQVSPGRVQETRSENTSKKKGPDPPAATTADTIPPLTMPPPDYDDLDFIEAADGSQDRPGKKLSTEDAEEWLRMDGPDIISNLDQENPANTNAKKKKFMEEAVNWLNSEDPGFGHHAANEPNHEENTSKSMEMKTLSEGAVDWLHTKSPGPGNDSIASPDPPCTDAQKESVETPKVTAASNDQASSTASLPDTIKEHILESPMMQALIEEVVKKLNTHGDMHDLNDAAENQSAHAAASINNEQKANSSQAMEMIVKDAFNKLTSKASQNGGEDFTQKRLRPANLAPAPSKAADAAEVNPLLLRKKSHYTSLKNEDGKGGSESSTPVDSKGIKVPVDPPETEEDQKMPAASDTRPNSNGPQNETETGQLGFRRRTVVGKARRTPHNSNNDSVPGAFRFSSSARSNEETPGTASQTTGPEATEWTERPLNASNHNVVTSPPTEDPVCDRSAAEARKAEEDEDPSLQSQLVEMPPRLDPTRSVPGRRMLGPGLSGRRFHGITPTPTTAQSASPNEEITPSSRNDADTLFEASVVLNSERDDNLVQLNEAVISLQQQIAEREQIVIPQAEVVSKKSCCIIL